MKCRFVIWSILSLIILSAIPSRAFDGKRKGFILGGGLGFGSTSFTQTVRIGPDSRTTPSLTKGAFMTDWKIGYATSEQLEFHYSAKLAWFPIININEESVLILSGTEAFGLSYSLSPSTPTFFVSAGLGFSSWETAFYTPADASWIGFGVYTGFGYEFARHYSVEFDISYGNPSDSDSTLHVETDATSVMLRFDALAY